ncbi:MAG TPA: RNA polymerase sigma factor [Chthonomonadales bacterium]|nr:RNA polymerase sigma factor [Chthonomonadales bacterium]
MDTPSGAGPFGQAPPGVRRVSTDDPDLPSVLRCQRGEPQAFVHLWRKYHDPLLRFFYSRTGDFHESQDLASLTLTTAMRATAGFRGTSRTDPDACCQYRTFVLTIARNTLSGWRKRRGRRPELPSGALSVDWGGAPDASAGGWRESRPHDGGDRAFSDIGDREAVCLALCEVPSDVQFRALFYRYFLDLSHQAIAELTDIRPESVNTRLQEARRTVARTYRRIGEAEQPGQA